MTAFSVAIDRIFADPNMAADAVWTPRGGGAAVTCRVIRKAPDEVIDFGQAQIHSETTMVDVRVSEISAPASQDSVKIGGEFYRVQGTPKRDRERLVWIVELVPA